MQEVLNVFQTITAFLVVMLIIVGIHEFGHFIVAKACNVKVLKFSIGMGKRIFTKKGRDGVEYSLSLLPIGGYVQMLDEQEMDESELKSYSEEERQRSFNRASKLKKSLIVGAGPLFNLLCALCVFTSMNMIGTTDVKPIVGNVETTLNKDVGASTLLPGDLFLSVDSVNVQNWQEVFMQLTSKVGNNNPFLVQTLRDGEPVSHTLNFSNVKLDEKNSDIISMIGVTPLHLNYTNEISDLAAGMPAINSGLKVGDQIIGYNSYTVEDFADLQFAIEKSGVSKIELNVIRQGEEIDVTITPVERNGKVLIGLSPVLDLGVEPSEILYTTKMGFQESFLKSIEQSQNAIVITFSFIEKLLTGDVSPRLMSGPIGIAEMADTTVKQGLTQFLSFLAFLNINIMIMNLLPIPVLDGGHLFKYAVETVIRRELNSTVNQVLNYIGLFLVLSLMALGISMDILNKL